MVASIALTVNLIISLKITTEKSTIREWPMQLPMKNELMRQELDQSDKDPNYQIVTRLFFRRLPEWAELERREAEVNKNEEKQRNGVRFK